MPLCDPERFRCCWSAGVYARAAACIGEWWLLLLCAPSMPGVWRGLYMVIGVRCESRAINVPSAIA